MNRFKANIKKLLTDSKRDVIIHLQIQTKSKQKGELKLKINRKKFELARARACMGQKEIVAAGFPKGTYCGALRGREIKPETVGRLAKIMGVDVLDLIDTDN